MSNKGNVFEKVEILDIGAEGKAVAKVDDMVVFIPFVAPGDVVDIRITLKKKNYREGIVVHFHKYSDLRTEPFCDHFGLCGGCKWQHLKYEHQLYYKQKQVLDNFQRIGKFSFPEISPIKGSAKTQYYRNKLEYTFCNRKWLTGYEIVDKSLESNVYGLGFHLPGRYDRILDLKKCYLQEEPSNSIRLAVKKYALAHQLTFHNVRKWEGFLRNLVIRTSSNGEVMAIMVFNYNDEEKIEALLNFIRDAFPSVSSLYYIINSKKNDAIFDLEPVLYSGKAWITEKMESLQFKVSPLSFFQTNSQQAYELYKIVRSFAGLTGKEVVYDLYTGTGTIANFIAKQAAKIIGIEYVKSAISDAAENSRMNGITNTGFFTGDIASVLNNEFADNNGKPEVIITDPPRAGMHEKVVNQMLSLRPLKIVYVSCNPATQARDIALMADDYSIEKVQPVDMFPHTHHVENVVLLLKKP